MYENNNTVRIDWKGLFIKLIIVALIVFAIFKGYELISNKKVISNSSTNAATQLFNANLESLRQAGENYFDYSNYPSEGQTVMVTLAELITKGNIKELYDANGNECDRESSYVALTNDNGQYKLKATLSCDGTSNYTIVMIGCECEGDECQKAIEKLEQKQETNSNKTTSSTKPSNNTSISKNPVNNIVNKKEETTTKKKSTQVIDMSQIEETTTKATTPIRRPKPTVATTTIVKRTTTKTNNKQYEVKFDSNGGDYIETQYVEKYETAYEPDAPERDDARFVGWYYKGKLFDFDTEITKDITLEAYYWETKTIQKQVYSAAWDTIGTTYVTVSHKLAIPYDLQVKMNQGIVKNVKIEDFGYARTMTSTNDLLNHQYLHSTTYDGYISSSYDHLSTNGSSLGRLYNIRVSKENYYEFDRWVKWSAYVGSQCSQPFYSDGIQKCNYGIVYTVVWQYDELTD